MCNGRPETLKNWVLGIYKTEDEASKSYRNEHGTKILLKFQINKQEIEKQGGEDVINIMKVTAVSAKRVISVEEQLNIFTQSDMGASRRGASCCIS